MPFEFATAGRILFGAGVSREISDAAGRMGKRPLVVTGASPERATGLTGIRFRVTGEPTVEMIRSAAAHARHEGCDMVVAIGGGSAIDAGKALAAMLANPGDLLDYLEVVGRGQPLPNPSVPMIAVPTTAGTGSEVTRNAVLGSPEHRVKASLRSPHMLPRLAVVDPELTVPPPLTASTGLDALTQLIEPYVSIRANAMTDLFCVEGIRLAARALPEAWQNGADREARAAMSWASLLGGMALANAGLGAVHGFAAPLGGMFSAPHGAICAALLPHVMAANVDALRRRTPDGAALRRYSEVASLLTGLSNASAYDGVRWVAELCRRLETPPLRAYGIAEKDLEAVVDRAEQASSMKANPIRLEKPELLEIAARAL